MVSSRIVRILARLLKTAVGSSAYAALAFLGAGRTDWTRGWIYAAVFVGVSVAGTLILQCTNPSLMDARAKGIRKDAKAFDKAFFLMFVPLVLISPVLAGADAVRFGWAPLPWETIVPGALLFVIGSAFGTWTMIGNRYAETTVRIQDERGHAVVTTGPYRIVRHPMYAGTLLGLPGTALMLGSAWALVPMALIFGLFVWRTAREDRTLRQELAGYEDYTKTTRYRLMPGVW